MITSRESRIGILNENINICNDKNLKPEFRGGLVFGPTHVSCAESFIREDGDEYDRSRVIFEQTDTITSALKYRRKTGVDFLVFASSRHYGGGVWNGSKAQEEDIFLCTDLCMDHNNAQEKFYPLNGCMAMDCHIIRDSNFEVLEYPANARAFFCPAPNLNLTNSGYDFWTRMCTFSDTTFDYVKGECLVIGAWGCGVFKNNPEEVADMFRKSMSMFLEDYRNVVVSIPDENMLNIFKKKLS